MKDAESSPLWRNVMPEVFECGLGKDSEKMKTKGAFEYKSPLEPPEKKDKDEEHADGGYADG